MGVDRSNAGTNRDLAAQRERDARRLAQQLAATDASVDAVEASVATIQTDLDNAEAAITDLDTEKADTVHEHTAAETTSGVFNHARLGTGGGGSSKFLREDGTWQSVSGGSTTIATVSVAFTDGDTARRVTVADAGVGATSYIVGTIRRPDTTEANDVGHIYTANIVSIGSGTFDLLVSCMALDGTDTTLMPPNETVQFQYLVYTP